MRRYGSDKPDLRFELELVDVAELFQGGAFGLFAGLAESDGNRVIALRWPGGAALSRRDFDAVTELAKTFGAKGLAYVSLAADGIKGSIARFVDEPLAAALRERTGAQDGDAILFVGDASRAASDVAGRLRLEIGERLGLRKPDAFAFCWVLGFPLFERDEESGEITFSHHPFTAPAPGQEALFDTDPLAITAQHYDLVLNGYELGSGSIRNHQAEFQRKVFKRLGLSDEADRRPLRLLHGSAHVRRAAARRDGARYRPHRDARLRRVQHPRRHRVPEEPNGARRDDGRPLRRPGPRPQRTRPNHRRAAARVTKTRTSPKTRPRCSEATSGKR